MTAFANALKQYREALAASQAAAAADVRGLFQLHVDTLGDIEVRYAETSDPNACRLLVESAKIIHTPASFVGPHGERLREALGSLVREVTPNDT